MKGNHLREVCSVAPLDKGNVFCGGWCMGPYPCGGIDLFFPGRNTHDLFLIGFLVLEGKSCDFEITHLCGLGIGHFGRMVFCFD